MLTMWVLLYLTPVLYMTVESVSLDELQNIFGDKICVQGSILDLGNKQLRSIETRSSIVTDVNISDIEKLSLSKIHELAQFNEIKYYYELEKEEGLSHNKRFKIKLKLGDEEYRGEGTSIKRAQRSAVANALENTQFQHPPMKIKNKGIDNLTPTVLLNNLAAKMGVAVHYTLITDDFEAKLKSGNVIDERSKKSYIQKLNDSIYSEIKMRKDEPGLKGPFKVKVHIAKHIFFGESRTIQSAKHEAAANALKSMNKLTEENMSHCLKEGNDEECKAMKESVKSPISLIYEAAQKRKVDVSFEIIDETGPPHKKTFVTLCKLGDLSSTGEGSSKKDSKRAAAEKMIQQLPALPKAGNSMVSLKTNKNTKNKKKKKKIIKSNIDKLDFMLESVLDLGSNFIKQIRNSDGKSQNNKRVDAKSPSDEILELSNLLKFESRFSDFNEGDEYASVLSMDLKPSYICFGQGASSKMSRDKAANGGLTLLQKLGLLDKSAHTPESLLVDEKEESKMWMVEVKEDKDEL